MAITDSARAYYEKMFPGKAGTLAQTDPEFAELLCNFACDEVVNQDDLDDRTRFLAILAALLGLSGAGRLPRDGARGAALRRHPGRDQGDRVSDDRVSRGIGRVYPFLHAVNEVFEAEGIALPLPGQSTTTRETRLEAGNQTQVDIFGEGMRGFQDCGPEESRHINRLLADNCFGDYYTRTGLDHKQREMITFCFLAGQGGCEPQLTSHAAGNMRIGNDKAFLIKIISQCLPYLGYPRSLNALRCVNEAAK